MWFTLLATLGSLALTVSGSNAMADLVPFQLQPWPGPSAVLPFGGSSNDAAKNALNKLKSNALKSIGGGGGGGGGGGSAISLLGLVDGSGNTGYDGNGDGLNDYGGGNPDDQGPPQYFGGGNADDQGPIYNGTPDDDWQGPLYEDAGSE